MVYLCLVQVNALTSIIVLLHFIFHTAVDAHMGGSSQGSSAWASMSSQSSQV